MIGEKLIRVPIISSTNDFLKENWQQFPHGTVIVADVQTAGRGRLNRTWYSPEGGLWFSILFKPRKNMRPNFYTKLSAISLVRSLTRLKVEAKLKWPNDVYADGKKLAGVLTETIFEEGQLRAIIVGIGMNVNNEIPKELEKKATSLRLLVGEELERLSVLSMIFREMNRALRIYSRKPEALTRVWKNMLIQKEGQLVCVNVGGETLRGEIAQIDDESITLRIQDKTMRLSSLEIVDC
ncbi:MAG: Biotin--acetyl-CoA-carboxylase ligase [Thermotoga sp. 50_1627]|uniref:biotin--[acetyl-CoA-carboxylase] ligase n=1 Tax=Pseudothermotoga sp. TaxID=2033661 RepID=UPI00076DE5E7|nr:MAG: Biotin--acetyl-CoA-carboxylase ligase [Thermotoga sp. 50_64]KUK25548.1 MAG: Biotin--acetyl-CoA-carboxylase ligase [Thermotoga sp. 50_1627]MBC7116573.1 biotin--[acetyl-CoA-carboxylase] ligase [Pseudothermotoga sp.]MDK2922584.1 BirA family transcriptional regulator [Pseudothermotoga sp.]HBT40247.1 biotin--[acetyl-CoA-carboxylase] ligase [Pseudothermotoga sp.]